MSDHWAELRTLFDELVELDDAAREVRLREIGSRDPALRARLEAMLAADAEAERPSRDYEEVVRRSVRPAMGSRPETDPLGLLGATVGRYHIDALVGAGGMGVVYRATDRRLDRVAALKFLPPVWSLDERAKERFLHEARAASSLDDRNICTIYEADETADGTPYIAMAFYEGETLQTRLERGPLAVGEALELASQAAQGLTAAHARGLVHRDIKPANLLVTTDGALKILDFGVAKAADIGLTLTGQRPGTAAYMAPEQARGDEVDGRADLWSLGVVLYEMLTGARPAAAGPTSEPAPVPSALRPGVPTWVDALALQLIAHDPLERSQRAEDLLSALARRTTETPTGLAATDAGTASAGVPRRRGQAGAGSTPHGATAARARTVAIAGVGGLIAIIGIGEYLYLQDGSAPARPPEAAATSTRFLAVLPFENRSPDAENEYFADGVTDDVLAHLAQVPDFSVISRTTTMGYKGSTKRIPEIAEELGVDYVLDGSVQLGDAQVRISAQLVDGSTDRYLWAETYDRRLEDIFAVQTEIARSIVEALEVELSGSVAARIQRRPTEDLEAYDLFLLGRENHYRYDLQGNERAMDLFRRALERDPEFALARAWRARALVVYAVNLGMGANWADSAVAEARQAVQEQPDVADAHTALGAALSFSGQYEEAIAALEQALALNPNDWAAARYLGVTYTKIGAWDEAIRVTRRALELQGVLPGSIGPHGAGARPDARAD